VHHVSIAVPGQIQSDVWNHLRSNQDAEEAAFLFADVEEAPRGATFHVRSWYQVVPSDFEERGAAGIVLTDQCRAWLMKRAHDERRSLIECHSHPGPRVAVFSLYDFEGFTEFVPHVRWRLKGRPYAALVVADTSFDGLAWIAPHNPQPAAVDVLTTPGEIFYPTRRSIALWQEAHRGQI
jgi:hypothetical protein